MQLIYSLSKCSLLVVPQLRKPATRVAIGITALIATGIGAECQQFVERPAESVLELPQCPQNQVRDRAGTCCVAARIGLCDDLCSGRNPYPLAIILDEFSYSSDNLRGQPDRLVGTAVGQTTYAVQSFGGAYGGTRSIGITPSHDPLSGRARFQPPSGQMPSFLAVENTFTSAGSVMLTYDGDTVPGLSDYRGLCSGTGCLNLLQGGATALELGVWFDHPFANASSNLDLVFTFYDASDPTGRTFSQGRLTLDRRYDTPTFTVLSLPYAQLTQAGPSGPANLANIGAFSVFVAGAGNFSFDLGLTNLRTNSRAEECR